MVNKREKEIFGVLSGRLENWMPPVKTGRIRTKRKGHRGGERTCAGNQWGLHSANLYFLKEPPSNAQGLVRLLLGVSPAPGVFLFRHLLHNILNLFTAPPSPPDCE